MNIPHRRWLAVAAVIIASIGVFVAPYLMRGSPAQSNSSHGTTTTTPANNGNPNGQSSTTHGTGSTTTSGTAGTSGTQNGSSDDDQDKGSNGACGESDDDTKSQSTSQANCAHEDENETANNHHYNPGTDVNDDDLSTSADSTTAEHINHGTGHDLDSESSSLTIGTDSDSSEED
ncbi:MAG TPA: hypothetical protein VFE98_06775 [Candidatus Bathyarchaeia archaeon]|nr:hypothetical protein [Candidatus Bathyarchaeia archaeon]